MAGAWCRAWSASRCCSCWRWCCLRCCPGPQPPARAGVRSIRCRALRRWPRSACWRRSACWSRAKACAASSRRSSRPSWPAWAAEPRPTGRPMAATPAPSATARCRRSRRITSAAWSAPSCSTPATCRPRVSVIRRPIRRSRSATTCWCARPRTSCSPSTPPPASSAGATIRRCRAKASPTPPSAAAWRCTPRPSWPTTPPARRA